MIPVQLRAETRVVGRLQAVVQRVRRSPAGRPLPLLRLIELWLAWGNPGYSANVRYLQQVERLFRRSRGAVLECGSGATTLLLGLLAEKTGRSVWTFENHSGWGQHVQEVLQALNLTRVHVCHTPLRNFGSYEWYTPPTALPQPFGLVVCDGPRGVITGGRYGLLPVMGRHLRRDCRILLDDTHRSREQTLVRRWANEHSLNWNPLGRTGRCTELMFA